MRFHWLPVQMSAGAAGKVYSKPALCYWQLVVEVSSLPPVPLHRAAQGSAAASSITGQQGSEKGS